MAGYGLARFPWKAMAACLLFNALEAAGTIVWSTTKQRVVPNRLLGRVSSLDWFISIGLLSVSYALTGPVAQAIGVRATLVWAGALGAAVTFAFLFLPCVRDVEGSPLLREEPLGPMEVGRAPGGESARHMAAAQLGRTTRESDRPSASRFTFGPSTAGADVPLRGLDPGALNVKITHDVMKKNGGTQDLNGYLGQAPTLCASAGSSTNGLGRSLFPTIGDPHRIKRAPRRGAPMASTASGPRAGGPVPLVAFGRGPHTPGSTGSARAMTGTCPRGQQRTFTAASPGSRSREAPLPCG